MEEQRPGEPRQQVPRSGKKQQQQHAMNSEFGIEELKSFTFTYGVPDQKKKFTRAKKGVAEYCGRDIGKEMYHLVHDLEETEFKEPAMPEGKPKAGELERYKVLIKVYEEDKRRYKRYKSRVFRIIMGQCLDPMRNKLESLDGYKQMEKDDDVVGLLTKMQDLVYNTENNKYEYWSMQAVMTELMDIQQGDREGLQNFTKRFLAQVAAVEQTWGKLIPQKSWEAEAEEQSKAENAYLACLYLSKVNRNKYKQAIDDLNNDFLLGREVYPKDVQAMMTLLTNRRGGGGRSARADAMEDGVLVRSSFAQQGRKGGKGRANVECFICHEKGHYQNQCPNRPQSDNNNEDDKSVKSNKSGRKFGSGYQGFQIGLRRTGGPFQTHNYDSDESG